MEYEGIVDFSADGSKLVTISQEDKDGAVRIRDATTGAELVKIDDEVSINSPRALSPDGSRLAIVDTSKEAHVWDLESRHKLFGISHNDGIGSICFSPDGSRLFTSNLDGTVSIWDARYGRELVRMMLGKREYFTWTLTVSLDGTKLATESSSGIRVWDLGAIRKPTTMEQGFKVSDIAVSPDGSKMAIVGSRLAKVWDIKANRELISREIQAASVLSVAFSPDGSKLAIGTMWSGVDLLDAASGVELAKISLECPEEERDYCEHIGPDFSYDSVAFSPDGTKLAIASSDKTARIWDLVSSKEQARLKHEGSVNSVSFSPNGSILATASADGKARLWDVVSGTMLAEARLKGSAKAIDYSPDGSKIAVASDNESVSIWDSSLTRQLIQIWQEGSVGTLAFSNDGLYLATGSDDKTARVWDIESGKEIARIEHDGAVRSVDFSPDEAELASASDDGMIRISLWRPEDMIADACCRLSRNLTLEEWRQYMGDEPYANTCENNSCISSSNRKPELANTSSRNLSLIRRSILETKKRLMSVPELSSPKRQPELANTSSRNSSLIRSSILDTKKRLMLVPGLLRQ